MVGLDWDTPRFPLRRWSPFGSTVLVGYREGIVVNNQEITFGMEVGKNGFHMTRRCQSADQWTVKEFLVDGKPGRLPNSSDTRDPEWLPKEIYLSPMVATVHSQETAIADGAVTLQDGRLYYIGDLQYGVPHGLGSMRISSGIPSEGVDLDKTYEGGWKDGWAWDFGEYNRMC
jgi:hypothetical protein